MLILFIDCVLIVIGIILWRELCKPKKVLPRPLSEWQKERERELERISDEKYYNDLLEYNYSNHISEENYLLWYGEKNPHIVPPSVIKREKEREREEERIRNSYYTDEEWAALTPDEQTENIRWNQESSDRQDQIERERKYERQEQQRQSKENDYRAEQKRHNDAMLAEAKKANRTPAEKFMDMPWWEQMGYATIAEAALNKLKK